MNMSDKVLCEHIFVFNKEDNGGEALILKTEFFDNGDGGKEGIYTNQKLILSSYCNSASFDLHGVALTPEILRQLADELEQAKNKLHCKE